MKTNKFIWKIILIILVFITTLAIKNEVLGDNFYYLDYIANTSGNYDSGYKWQDKKGRLIDEKIENLTKYVGERDSTADWFYYNGYGDDYLKLIYDHSNIQCIHKHAGGSSTAPTRKFYFMYLIEINDDEGNKPATGTIYYNTGKYSLYNGRTEGEVENKTTTDRKAARLAYEAFFSGQDYREGDYRESTTNELVAERSI